jgi:hypothetical protein
MTVTTDQATEPTPSKSASSPRTPHASERVNDGVSEGPKARIADLLDAVVRFARAKPYSALAAAVVAGFVVGGGLSSRAGRMLLSAGARQAGQELLKQLL